MFVPAYNMMEHCKQAHDLHNDEARADELKECGVLAIEKKNVVKLFKTNPQVSLSRNLTNLDVTASSLTHPKGSETCSRH